MIGIAVVGCGRIDAMHATDIAVHPRFRLTVRGIHGGKRGLCEKSIDLSLDQSKSMAASENRRPHQMLSSGKRRSNHAAPLVHFFAERGRRALVLAEAALKSIADGRAVKVSEVG